MSDYNFLGLVNDINKKLNEVELTSANFATAIGYYSSAKDAVNSALKSINFEEFEWPFNHVTQEETLIAGVTRYSFPNDVKSVDMDSFRIKFDGVLGNKTSKLKILSYEDYLSKYVDQEYNTSNAADGSPSYVFRTPNFQYGVVPLPDKAYNIAYEYYRISPDLEDYDDVPSIPESFRSIISDGAIYYAYLFRGDLESASLSQQKFEKGVKDMRTIYINRYDYVRSHVIER